jgi:hypothetical protein
MKPDSPLPGAESALFVRPAWQRGRGVVVGALAGLAGLAGPFGVGSAVAELITIVNPGFESTSRALAVGEQSNGVGGAGMPVATRFPFMGGTPSWSNPVEVPGWRTFVQPSPSTATIRVGVLNPPLIVGLPFIEGYAGQHVLAIQNVRAGQVLSVRVQPDTRYRLDFLGGIGRIDSDYFFGVAFIAVDTPDTLPLDNQPGVSVLVRSSGLRHPNSDIGQMRPYFLEYTTPPTLPPEIAGKFLGILFSGSDGVPRVLYDDLRLQATAIPEPAALAGLGLFGLLAGRCRRA